MTLLDKRLEEFLSYYVQAIPQRSGRRYRSIPEIVLKEGQVFSTEPYTPEEERAILDVFGRGTRSKLKQCYYNAQSIAQQGELQYAEGFFLRGDLPIAIEHAWNYLPSGKVVDVTLREFGSGETCDPKKLLARARGNLENAYRGVSFGVDEIRTSWLRNKSAVMLLADPAIQRIVREEGPSMAGLQDMPMPENVQRPEMWTTAAIVQAVQDGFTFMIPFVDGESMVSRNAYWIAGRQYAASGLTVGPEHTPEITLVEPDEWIQVRTFFEPEMVPEKAWLAPPNENGVVPVFLEIDPSTIDWDLLNRGHQIRVRRGL